MLIALVHIPSNPIGVVVVAAVLLLVSRPIIARTTASQAAPWLSRILMASLVIHLLAAPAQIYVVDHFYGGIADWLRYDNQGSQLAPAFRHLDFSLSSAHVGKIVNNGSVSVVAGGVMALTGVNQVAAFMAFAWMSWLGTIFFYRAFTVTFPEARDSHRRYAILVFFLPSMIFWTADVSKEAIMMVSLGVATYGAALVLARRPRGFTYLTLGAAMGALISPNELLLLLAGFAVALMIRPADRGRTYSGIRRVAGLAFMLVLLSASLYLTLHYLHSSGGTLSLSQTNQNNNGTGAGFGSSGAGYSSSPLAFPSDVYTVLFDPTPLNAHSTGARLASLENLIIGVLILASLRRLRILPRTAFCRPYVMLCTAYTLMFIYAFAALGNLGLITRERVLMLPYLLVLLCIPRAPSGTPPRYPWEVRRKNRRQFEAYQRALALHAAQLQAAAASAVLAAGGGTLTTDSTAPIEPGPSRMVPAGTDDHAAVEPPTSSDPPG